MNVLQPTTPALSPGEELVESFKLCQQQLESLQRLSVHLDTFTTQNNTSDVEPFTELPQLLKEIESRIEQLVNMADPLSETLSQSWCKWCVKVDQLKSSLQSKVGCLERLIRAIETGLACEQEATALVAPMEQEYHALKLSTNTNGSLDVTMRATRALLNRLKTEGAVARDTLDEAIENILKFATCVQPLGFTSNSKQLFSSLKRFENRVEELKIKLSQLLMDLSELVKNEKTLHGEIRDVLKELRLITTEASKLHTKLKSSLELADFSECEPQLANINARLDMQEHQIQHLHKELDIRMACSSTEVKANLCTLDEKFQESKSLVHACQQVHQDRQTTLTHTKFALEQCLKSLGQLNSRIDHALRWSQERTKEPRLMTTRPNLVQQIDSLQHLTEEVKLAGQLLAHKVGGTLLIRPDALQKSNLISQIQELLRISESLEHPNELKEWIQLQQDLELEENRLTQAKLEVEELREVILGWDMQMDEFESAMKTLEQTIQDKTVIDTSTALASSEYFLVRKQLLDEVQLVQENQLPQMKTQLTSLQRQANDIFKGKHTTGPMTSGEEKSVAQRLSKAEGEYQRITSMISTLCSTYRKRVTEEDQLLHSVAESLEWIKTYEADVEELERHLTCSDSLGSTPQSPSRVWILKDMSKIDQLERERKPREELVRDLLERLRKTSAGSNKPYIQEMNKGLQNLHPFRLKRILEELIKTQKDLEQYEARVARARQALKDFETKYLGLMEADKLSAEVFKNRTFSKAQDKEEQKWIQLLDEMNTFKTSDFKELENLEVKLAMPSVKCTTEQIRNSLERLQAKISKKMESNTQFNALKHRINMMLNEFEEDVSKGVANYCRLTKNLLIPLSRDSISDCHLPSKICDHLHRVIEGTIKRLNIFQKDTLGHLGNTWQHIVTEAKSMQSTEQLELSFIHKRFLELREDADCLDKELQALLPSILHLRQDWIDQERVLEMVDVEVQSATKRDNFAMNSNNLLSQDAEPQLLPTEFELSGEMKSNSNKLNDLLLIYQQELNQLRKIHKNLTDGKTNTLEALNDRLDFLFRHIHSLAIHETKFADEPRNVTSPSPVNSPVLIHFTERIQEQYQTKLRQLNENLNSSQTRLTNYSRVVQAIKELDTWQLEFYSALMRWGPQFLTYASENDLFLGTQLRFALDTGQAYVHSIRDWSKHWVDSDRSEDIDQFAQFQVRRANQMILKATQHFQKLSSQADQHKETVKEAADQVDELERWLTVWTEKFSQLQLTVTTSLASCDNFDGLRRQDAELRRWLEQSEALNVELKAKYTVLENQSHTWLNLGAIQKTQFVAIEQQFKERMTTASNMSTHLTQVKLRLTDMANSIQNVSQWIREVFNQLPKAREGRSPVRIPTYAGIQAKSVRVLPSVPDCQDARTRSVSPSSYSPNRTAASTLRQMSIQHTLLQTYRDRLGLVDKLVEELNHTTPQIAQELNSAGDLLNAALANLRIESNLVATTVCHIRNELEGLYATVTQAKHETEDIVKLVQEFENGVCEWQTWYDALIGKVKRTIQRSVMGFHDVRTDDRWTEREINNTPDIVRPVIESIQRYQDVLGKLQSVYTEEQSFHQRLEELKQWVKQHQEIDRSDPNDSFMDTDTLARRCQSHKNLTMEIEQNQPKLLELSDKADSVCRASSSAALAMHCLLMRHPVKNTAVDAGRASPTGLSNFPQMDIIDTVGACAKRELNTIRQQWKVLSQSASQVRDSHTEAVLITYAQE
ncbi:golgin subfamily B member 1 [Paragonimus westermani]|uniref:Golgin subfamily B member 1 n=1 Tax=Paragonimus westermani TaxID=34504 RepID=A0A5J4NX57_9TREM|nr:golgin subfamily B member 1 [Paragonimus westermani]